jgi:hypothetical protein
MRILRLLRAEDVPPAWIIDRPRDPEPEIRPTAPPPEEPDVEEPAREEPVERGVIILEI